MDEFTRDYKKVVEATRVIAEVCEKYHHFDREKKEIVCHEDCPFHHLVTCGEEVIEFCRLHNYPFDYSSEVEYFEDEDGEEDE